ncbi:MAG: RICIN domain-containing protein [Conexibacter sp.]
MIALLVLIASGPAAALGTDDSCPEPDPGRHLIVSDAPVIYGTAASDEICGGPSANLIIGGLLDDEIYGGGGDDILIGGHGVDTLDGGSGNDWLRGGTNRDIYVGGANGVGFDTASFADMTPTNGVAGMRIDLGAGTADAGGVVDELSQIDKVIGSAFDDTITAPATGVAQMDGGYGDDTLVGTGGDDRMWGEGGSDSCTNDGFPVECVDGQGAHRPTSAFVKVDSRAKDPGLIVLGAEGAVNDTLTVTRLNESQLRVSGGARVEVGSNCTRTNETTADCNIAAARYVVVSGDQGTDRLTAGDNISSGTIDMNGGTGSDILTGGSGEEVLFTGEGGRDALTGNGGNDALISEGDPSGTSGADTLNGGAGDDQLVTDNACGGHTLTGGEGNDIIGFARQDYVNGVLTGVYANVAEGIAFAMNLPGECGFSSIVGGAETLEGTNQNDTLYGNEGANTIWGRAGDDRIYGLGGNDVVRGQDGDDSVTGGGGVDSLYGGEGWDDLHAADNVEDALIECGAGYDPGAERDERDPAGVGCNDRIPTETFITLDQIRNGTPGAASVHGHVLRNGNPISGTVNVNFQKLVEGHWETMSTAVRTLDANGYYEVRDWSVGIGDWRVRAVFPEQAHYAQSESEYKTFSIALIPTETFITLDGTTNGTPGTASVHGHVLHNGNPVAGTVNVNFQKYVNGTWETMSTAVRTLDANGYYEVVNWGVGVGEWRVRAVYPQQGEYEGSESEYKTFSIQPVPTETFITLDGTRNGAPGTASVHGHVLRTNGSPAAGTVNVNFQKLVSNVWTTQSTAVRTLDANGYYEVREWGVGVGSWRVRAVFNAQGDYSGSESEYRTFSIQPVATETFITLDQTLNGQPGYASVSGHVLWSGRPVSGTVNVNFQKLVNNVWTTQSTAQRGIDGNGYYEVKNWGVGVGQWRVRAVFNAQGDFAGSESEYKYFQIKSGYRLIGRQSGRCLSLSGNNGTNGTAIILWDCSGAPNPGDGQVFTLVPMEASGQYYELKINSTGKCVDVTGVSYENGAYLQEWDCLGAGQANQQWDPTPISGQPPYEALIAKHDGRCMDVLGQATGNGARVGQWDCWWGGNQQWSWQAIE